MLVVAHIVYFIVQTTVLVAYRMKNVSVLVQNFAVNQDRMRFGANQKREFIVNLDYVASQFTLGNLRPIVVIIYR